MANASTRGTSLLAAVLALALGAFALSQTGDMSQLGAVFPRTAAILLIVAAFALSLRSLLPQKPIGAETGPAKSEPPSPTTSPPLDLVRLAGIAVALLAWALLLKPLGFVATAALGLVAVGLVTYRERMSLKALALHLLAGAILIAGFYGLFAEVLRVAIP